MMMESWRLNYYRSHQKQLRAELYKGLIDAIFLGETEGASIGKRIILPSLEGLIPKSDVIIAFSIALRSDFSQGAIWMILASGTETLATPWIGVGAP